MRSAVGRRTPQSRGRMPAHGTQRPGRAFRRIAPEGRPRLWAPSFPAVRRRKRQGGHRRAIREAIQGSRRRSLRPWDRHASLGSGDLALTSPPKSFSSASCDRKISTDEARRRSDDCRHHAAGRACGRGRGQETRDRAPARSGKAVRGGGATLGPGAAVRKGILVSVLGVAAAMIAAAVFDPFGPKAGSLSFSSLALDGTKVTMARPRLAGFRSDGQPYVMTAERAAGPETPDRRGDAEPRRGHGDGRRGDLAPHRRRRGLRHRRRAHEASRKREDRQRPFPGAVAQRRRRL